MEQYTIEECERALEAQNAFLEQVEEEEMVSYYETVREYHRFIDEYEYYTTMYDLVEQIGTPENFMEYVESMINARKKMYESFERMVEEDAANLSDASECIYSFEELYSLRELKEICFNQKKGEDIMDYLFAEERVYEGFEDIIKFKGASEHFVEMYNMIEKSEEEGIPTYEEWIDYVMQLDVDISNLYMKMDRNNDVCLDEAKEIYYNLPNSEDLVEKYEKQ